MPSHVDGPPLAHTGGFGEKTCQDCHMDLELNSPHGQLGVEGFPERFEVGRAYVLTVLLRGEGMGRGGFQGAFRYRDGEDAGSQAGSPTPLDERTIVRREGGVAYVHHTAEGSLLDGDEAATWTFEWVAPEVPTAVAFHLTANSANGDNSPFGDLIYAAVLMSTPAGTEGLNP